MKNRFLLWSLLLAALGLAATLLVWQQLPERVPVHWSLAGAADAWRPRGWLFAPPAVLLLAALLWRVLPGVSPARFGVDGFERTWWFCGIAVSVLLAAIHGMLLWGTLGGAMAIETVLPAGLGLFVVLVGNVMGKVRRNFWLGVRTPWTLADERVWYATHRLAGKTMVTGGLLAIVFAAAGLPPAAAIGVLLPGTLAPAAYSLLAYRRLMRAAGH